MGKTRKMRLVAFLKTGPTCHHHGMWRHPETENDPNFYHKCRCESFVSL